MLAKRVLFTGSSRKCVDVDGRRVENPAVAHEVGESRSVARVTSVALRQESELTGVLRTLQDVPNPIVTEVDVLCIGVVNL